MKKMFKYYWIIILLLAGNSYAQVKQVESVGMTVRSMDRSVKFYHEVLGFTKISDEKSHNIRNVQLKLGDETIVLTQYLSKKGRAIPEDMKSNDLYFQHIAIVVSNMDQAYAMLKKYRTNGISPRPQTIPRSNVVAAGIRAYYFHDIDNHDLELICFPKGKGQPKWQIANGKLFLGIDHTAIGISNTGKSLHFYKDLLGLKPKAESWNKGKEQRALSQVRGASLHITDINAKAGPGIEFLQYLVPGPGKLYPKDTKAEDSWYWQITLVTDQLAGLYRKLSAENFRFQTKITGNGAYRYFIVQDPDGHAILIKD
ncbi:VOC family protein [Mucilaginibacter gilvus]|uniref:VOC domain-containing protein n=1 Tax=Mucilaginibacter gilvus TaxID=2305909 RepID=A0A444MNE5_9SPHI|nr:VOC family protein [Mucilaginibacter gilvus]RWY51225.1 hypothetical protein EPL05_14280 [Mucilaginibacter gilvus]